MCVCMYTSACLQTHTHLKRILLEPCPFLPVPRVGAPVVVVPDVGVEGQAAGHAQEGEGDGEGLLCVFMYVGEGGCVP